MERLKKAIRQAAGENNAHFFDATRTAAALFGNSLGANMFMLGFGYQHSGVPVSAEAIERAIELNGEAVAMNPPRSGGAGEQPTSRTSSGGSSRRGRADAPRASDLDSVIAERERFLAGYQNAAYGKRYRERIERLRRRKTRLCAGRRS